MVGVGRYDEYLTYPSQSFSFSAYSFAYESCFRCSNKPGMPPFWSASTIGFLSGLLASFRREGSGTGRLAGGHASVILKLNTLAVRRLASPNSGARYFSLFP